MVFSSAIFLYWFFPITFLLYFIIPNKNCRNIILTVASIVFYAFGQLQYLPLLLFSVFCNYIFGILLSKQYVSVSKRKNIVTFAVIVNIGMLCIFKYTDFFIESLNTILHTHIPTTGIPLPIGISFFTFQGISYVIDVYRNRTEGTNNFLKVLLYISFFPQLIAGPIIKYHDISNEIDNRVCTLKNTAEGLRRFTIGLAKKLLLSNTVGLVADSVFQLNTAQIDMPLAWLGAICYVFQIYFDFSGYSDMAIGLGKVFGFHFKENFNYPYTADSIKEFWRRWHISLSSWFRDYLYIPLGGNQLGRFRTGINKLIVFFATGFWHGANVTFILWGLFHGLFSVLEQSNSIPIHKMKGKVIGHIYTMLIVTIGFVLFRSENLYQAASMITKMFIISSVTLESTLLFKQLLSHYTVFILLICVVACLGIVPKLYQKGIVTKNVVECGSYVFAMILLVWSVIDLSASTFNPFIYFQF
ncbi:MBOAT family protein [Clostridium sp. MD294]|uniref:MBOAT family O-acyltransferase n=1 Tax=Clostridium sp. MD294 TaxID=97138 RepID=UPI0002CC7074|nr:MBOAT family protein [Clostridium sp. MD294]NDO46184.1 MBOAT family protein [Clostridium sp. MD294]USF30149.1 Peptidoglycan O-acetyltransferase [Clostridium sp. MD294]